MLTEVYLGLGSNLGDKRGNIERAVESLRGISSGLRVSSLYETAPVGVTLHLRYSQRSVRDVDGIGMCSSC